MKVCKTCGLERNEIEFGSNFRSADGMTYECKPCLATRQAAWRANNPKRAAEIEHKSWNEKQKFSKHGLTKAQWEELLDSQGGVCAICGLAGEEGPKRGLFVDHDHSCCPGQFSCGECVRGLLHMKCNSAIGYLNDDPLLVEAALAYLSTNR